MSESVQKILAWSIIAFVALMIAGGTYAVGFRATYAWIVQWLDKILDAAVHLLSNIKGAA